MEQGRGVDHDDVVRPPQPLQDTRQGGRRQQLCGLRHVRAAGKQVETADPGVLHGTRRWQQLSKEVDCTLASGVKHRVERWPAEIGIDQEHLAPGLCPGDREV
ncbi:MAG: hypothetical protein U0794_19205 [Isosphaeraceae bacterium]